MRNRNNVENDQVHIIGAYASHGWAVNKGMMDGGNRTCFLFNFHKNLRFNAVAGFKDYMSVETATIDDREQRTIMFGEELQISQEFKKVESKILRASDPNAKFIFGDKYMQEHRINCIIPNTPHGVLPQPTHVEVWLFKLDK